MRALAFGDFGEAPSVIEAPTPEITAPDEVLVAVKAASLNRFDAVVAAGFLQGMLEHQFPVTLGRDFAGVVEAVGGGVTEFSVGDEVFGMIGNMVLSNGSLADHVVVSAQHLAHKPETIGFTEAAALPLAGSTALAAVDWVQAGPGKAVLIVGATGGVGNYAIQLAHARGATVIATGLADDEETLQGIRCRRGCRLRGRHRRCRQGVVPGRRRWIDRPGQRRADVGGTCRCGLRWWPGGKRVIGRRCRCLGGEGYRRNQPGAHIRMRRRSPRWPITW